MTEYLKLFYLIIAYIVIVPFCVKSLRVNAIVTKFISYFFIFILHIFIFEYQNTVSIWVIYCFYSFFVCIYIFIYGALETSISVKMLNYLAKKKAVNTHNLTNKIILKSFYTRINNLIKKKMIIKKRKKYILTQSGIKMVNKLNKVKKLFKLKKLGFYS